jgi:ABC-type glycerol-3-phosphate transport system substrate-binding protein
MINQTRQRIMLMTIVLILACCGFQTGAAEPIPIRIMLVGIPPAVISTFQTELLPAFEKQNPDIKVELTTANWTTRPNKMLVEMAAGVGPDIVSTGAANPPIEAAQGLLMPIDKYLAQWKGRDRIQPGLWENQRYDGKTYGVPQYVDLRLFAYFKDQVQEAGYPENFRPNSWDELRRAAAKLNRMDGDKLVRRGMSWAWTSTAAGTAQSYAWFMAMNGSNPISDDMRQVTLNTSKGIETLQYLADLYDTVNPTTNVATNLTFTAGTVSIAQTNSGTVTTLQQNAPELLANIGVFSPRFSSSAAPIAQAFPNGLAITAGCKYPDEAWRVLEYLLSQEVMEQVMMETGWVMSRMDLYNTVRTKLPDLLGWFEEMQYAKTMSVIPNTSQLMPLLTGYIYKVYNKEQSVTAALENASREWQTSINEFWAQSSK